MSHHNKTFFSGTIAETNLEVYIIPENSFCILSHVHLDQIKIIVATDSNLADKTQQYMVEFINQHIGIDGEE